MRVQEAWRGLQRLTKSAKGVAASSHQNARLRIQTRKKGISSDETLAATTPHAIPPAPMHHWAASSLPTTTPAIPSLLLAAAVLVGGLLVLAAQEVRPGVAESSPAPVAMASDVECFPRQAWAAESSKRLVPWPGPAPPQSHPTTPAQG